MREFITTEDKAVVCDNHQVIIPKACRKITTDKSDALVRANSQFDNKFIESELKV